MITAWFLVEYLIDPLDPQARYCALVDEPNIDWAESECMGNQAICRVNTTQEVIDSLAQRFTFLTTALDSVIPNSDRDRLKTIGLAASYTPEQVAGVESAVSTYKQWAAAMLTYRQKPRWTGAEIILDGGVITAGEVPE